MTDPGFEIIEGVLPAETCDRILDRLTPGNTRHLMRLPHVAALAAEAELIDIASRQLGTAAIPFRAALFDKSGERRWLVAWHQDTVLPLTARIDSPEWGPWTRKEGVLHARAPAWALEKIVALRVHLDDSDADNGPLKVIPGSHALGILTPDSIRQLAREKQPVETPARRGGVVVMRPLLVHASSKARAPRPRRVIHIEYASQVALSSGVDLAVG